MIVNDLDGNSISDDLTLLVESVVVRLNELGETELSGDENLLSTGELELSSSEGLLGVGNVLGGNSDGHEDLSNVDSCGFTESLSEGTSHTLLKSIGSSTRKHLVNSNNVPGVDSHSHVEVLSSALVLHVLVASNSGCLESLRGDLLLLVTNHMDAG